MAAEQPITLVTGAAGGIGSACARALAGHRLFLADVDDARLVALAGALGESGISVAGTHAGDLGDDGEPARLVAAARSAGAVGGLIHAAGLSPALAGARAIMRLNARATEALLDAVEAVLEPGFTAVLIASIAGHFATPDGVVDQLCGGPTDADFLDRAVTLMIDKAGGDAGYGAASNAYCYSKRANILSVQRRCADWGAHRARIASISPGLVDTDMGRREVADDPGAAAMLAATPLGWVQPDAIADVARFLLSPAAGALSGCDIRVDGGALGAMFAGRTTSGACVA